MKTNHDKSAFIDRLLNEVSERWGPEELKQLRSELENIADALWKLLALELDPFEEPSGAILER
jgi:hypothetical protein